ncbi:MAG: hypothetical protein ACRDG3_08475, partial [Tepidiformaceae bacterium]
APGFYSSMLPAPGIYAHFRQGLPIQGTVTKPTGARAQELQLRGSYQVNWVDCGPARKCAVIPVGG